MSTFFADMVRSKNRREELEAERALAAEKNNAEIIRLRSLIDAKEAENFRLREERDSQQRAAVDALIRQGEAIGLLRQARAALCDERDNILQDNCVLDRAGKPRLETLDPLAIPHVHKLGRLILDIENIFPMLRPIADETPGDDS